MSKKLWLGIDNGVSGQVSIIGSDSYFLFKTPIKRCLNYTKKKQWVNRIDFGKLYALLKQFAPNIKTAYIERPLVNPMRFKSSVSALRAYESTIVVLEILKISFDTIDSRIWQKDLIPLGVSGPELKQASLQVGMRLFPKIDWSKFDDADGLLIAEYCRRKNL